MTAASSPPKVWTEAEIIAALRQDVFGPPEYGLLTNVSCGVGRVQRYADALAMSLFPARGLTLTGIEIKSTRSDWLRELKKPDKADPIFTYCHRWYLVAANDSVYKEIEIPDPWGVMHMLDTGKLKTVKQAPLLTPKPIDMPFMAAVFRRATEQQADERQLDTIRQQAYDQGREHGEAHNKRELERAQDTAEDLARRIREFKEASGLEIHGWRQPKEVGEAVALYLRGDLKRVRVELQRMDRVADTIKETIKRALDTTP